MNLQTSNRRQDMPVRLGNHGYRIDGDYASLEAELHIPPYLSGQGFGLELWACPTPHGGGELQGVKLAELPLDLPTPIGPHLHRVEARAPLTPPAGGGEHAMVMVLVCGAGESRRVHDYANYARLQRFTGPTLEGAVGYALEDGAVVLSADLVLNPRPAGNVSGSLCLELWALSEPYAGGVPRGQRLAAAALGSVYGDHQLTAVARHVPFTAPPPGRWHVALLLREWTLSTGYVTRDYRGFDVLYERAAEAPIEPQTPDLATPAANARPTPRLRLLEPTPAPAAAVSPPAEPRRLSLHAASIEELAKLPGVSLKVAKEIIKGRPFASLDALLSVRGIGEKTLRRLKTLLTL